MNIEITLVRDSRGAAPVAASQRVPVAWSDCSWTPEIRATVPRKNVQHRRPRRLKRPRFAFVLCPGSFQWMLAAGLLMLSQVETVRGQSQQPSSDFMPASEITLESGRTNIWEHGIGEGFRSTVQSFGFSAGATYGIAAFGGHEAHDLALASFSYGHMLGHVVGEGHWYRGNPEFRLELLTGAQFSPNSEWLVGLTPHLRYNFATGTRWIPFLDGGAGVTATGIGPPDLSGTFEFNLQASVGIQWYLRDNVALSVEARYVHWSCARLHAPNLGLNGITGMLGITYFF
jgi:lipid A 3-O-deacylase